jgi:transposase
MIPMPAGVRVWLATGHTDMRKGFDGLALIVQETLRRDPHSGHLFVFRGRRGDLIKCLWHDGQGLCLFAKRLERGRFLWPSTADGTVTISTAQLGYLLEGIDRRENLASERGRLTIFADGPARIGFSSSVTNAAQALPSNLSAAHALILAE